jgi:hypothetical protein
MAYNVEIFQNQIHITGEGFEVGVNFVSNYTSFHLDKARIVCQSCVESLFYDLPKKIEAIYRKAERHEHVEGTEEVSWNLHQLEFKCFRGADVGKIVRKFAKVLRDIEPLVELAEIIFKQLQRKPLNATTSIKLYLPVPTIGDMRVEQWLKSRERAGLDIDPVTAEVACAYEQWVDPYRVYSEIPGRYGSWERTWFACSPGSDVWVVFDDLPRATRDALETRIREEQSRQK